MSDQQERSRSRCTGESSGQAGGVPCRHQKGDPGERPAGLRDPRQLHRWLAAGTAALGKTDPLERRVALGNWLHWWALCQAAEEAEGVRCDALD